MRPATPSTGQGLPIPKPKPQPTPYRVTFTLDGQDFVAFVNGFTREGAAALASELLFFDYPEFDPTRAKLARMEVMP